MVCTSRRRSGQEDCSEENDLFSTIIGRAHPFIQLQTPCDRFFRTELRYRHNPHYRHNADRVSRVKSNAGGALGSPRELLRMGFRTIDL